MSFFGGIAVKIVGDNKDLLDKLSQTQQAVSKTGTKLRKGVNSFGKYSVAGVAAASAIGTAMVRNQMKTIDALAKTADRLGLTTEALGGLQRAAELSGAGVTTMNMALQRMTRRVAEAAQGSGEAQTALKELGLDAKALSKLAPDEQFRQVAEQMKNVTEQGDKVRLAMRLFDSEGVKLVNTLDMGADGLAKAEQEAKALGLALDRADASKVEAANDALFTSGQAIEGVVNKVAVKFAPMVEALAQNFNNAAIQSNGFAETVDSVFRHAAKAVGVFSNAMRGINLITKGIKVGVHGLNSAIMHTYASMSRGVENFVNSAVDKLNWLIEKINMIPNVSVAPIEKFTLSAATMFTDMANIAGQELANAMQEFHDLAMQPLPSEELEKWVGKVTALAQKMAETKKKITNDGAKDEVKTVKMTEKDKYSAISNSLSNVSTLMNTENRKMFELGKAAAISGAIVDGYAAITGAYKVGAKVGGPVMGAAFAASAGIATAAQIQQIASTKFGSAGTGQSINNGQVVNNTGAGVGPTEPNRNISIALTGSSFSGGDIRNLIGAINDELGDGVALNINGG